MLSALATRTIQVTPTIPASAISIENENQEHYTSKTRRQRTSPNQPRESAWTNRQLHPSTHNARYAAILYAARPTIEPYLGSPNSLAVQCFRLSFPKREYRPIFGNIPRIPLTTRVFYNRTHGFGKIHHGISATPGHQRKEKKAKSQGNNAKNKAQEDQNDEEEPPFPPLKNRTLTSPCT